MKSRESPKEEWSSFHFDLSDRRESMAKWETIVPSESESTHNGVMFPSLPFWLISHRSEKRMSIGKWESARTKYPWSLCPHLLTPFHYLKELITWSGESVPLIWLLIPPLSWPFWGRASLSLLDLLIGSYPAFPPPPILAPLSLFMTNKWGISIDREAWSLIFRWSLLSRPTSSRPAMRCKWAIASVSTRYSFYHYFRRNIRNKFHSFD